MPNEVILPRVDMDMATGKIAKWFVEPGATVTKGQPLFEIETDKAAMEIEAPASGTIRDLARASGESIPVGSVVAWIFAEGETSVPAAKRASEPQNSDGETARLSVEDHPFDSALPTPLQDGSGVGRQTDSTAAPADRPRATPMARRLARTHGLNLADLTGTGPRGRIQAADIVIATGHRPDAIPSMPVDAMAPAAELLDSRPTLAPDATAASPSAVRSLPAVPQASGSLNLVRLRDGEGRPTLLLHGFGADISNWRPFLAARVSERPVLGLDLPGHGGSPLGTVADFVALVDVVERFLGESGLGAHDLVGHSLGGAVAAALAGRGALDVRALLLLSPAGLGPEVNGNFVRGFLGASSEASLTPWMRELVVDPAAITPAFVRATLKAREGGGLVVSQRRIADAIFPDDTQAFSIRPDLGRLVVPTRIVFGTADRIIPARHTTGLPGMIALHLFPGVGHMPHIEQRETVATILAQMTVKNT